MTAHRFAVSLGVCYKPSACLTLASMTRKSIAFTLLTAKYVIFRGQRLKPQAD
jgi:hypothetical protein